MPLRLIFTAIVAAIWLKEPLSQRKIGGLLLGIVGVLALVGWSPLPRSRIDFYS